ncbi:uncharacterized protein HD556DRAFT_1445464 [Suillus plorans]|uniref:Protein kinase domain-containing protein n=1 Tax=Suillus plorans TaxID=116603 RepID=A0A9P7DG41_9AGAM|nr:uncharacterized protein HD556DRAFT_1445464 [Suillus plorans]KAG1791198.1 hypothetical protein HD556DRAFT_1445464 [Suillus plorans]
MQAVVSTTSYRQRLYASVSTTNALPAPCNQSQINEILEEELNGNVLWEEKLLPQDVESVMDAIFIQSDFTPEDISRIHYQSFESSSGRRSTGVPVFIPAGRGASGTWQPDTRNVQPRTLANTRATKRQRAQKQREKTQNTRPRSQMSAVASAVIDTEVEGWNSLTASHADKSFSTQEYDYKNSNKKRIKISAMAEGRWTLLFNTVQAIMYSLYAKCFPNPSKSFPFRPMDLVCGQPKRIWSSKFSTIVVPDDTNAQKPDIVLVNCSLGDSSLRWCNIITCVELTDSELSTQIPLYRGSATKGYLLMREQPWRRFVFIFSIAHNQLRLHYFDRSGLIISRPISITKNPVRLLDVLNTVTLAHTNTLGFDPTMHMCDCTCKNTHHDLREKAIGWIEGKDGTHLSIMSILWRSQGFFSRGTICYRVQTPGGDEYALKDCWVPEDRRYHEGNVLRMVAGVPNVVRLVDEWDVLYDGMPDCTDRIRASRGMSSAGFIRRYHRRLLLSPCGEPLMTYSSRTELLKAFHDIVVAHSLMLKCNVLHGDLSPNNFIIYDGQGYFIDFDHAGITTDSNSIRSEGTGTRPYMSIRLLREGSNNNGNEVTVFHTAGDDLESLFYIFVEFATTFDGPHAMTKDNARKPMWYDYWLLMGDNSWAPKQGLVLSHSGDRSLMSQTTSFFGPFGPIIQEWRLLIRAAAEAASQTNGPPSGVSHEELATLLHKWLSQLPPEIPEDVPSATASPLSVASSSRITRPSGPNNIMQPATALRRSARIQMKL